MRLGVSMLAIHTPGGIGRYARILGALLLTRFDGELFLFLQHESDLERIISELPESERQQFTLRQNTHLILSKYPHVIRYLLHQWELPLRFKGLSLDIYLDPDIILPPVRARKKCIVVHDVTPFTNPWFLGLKARIIYGLSSAQSVRSTDCIICVSEKTRKGLAEIFPDEARKMLVLDSCLSPKFYEYSRRGYQHADEVRVDTSFGEVSIKRPFILYVGDEGPRKNVSTLLKAFHLLRQKGYPHKLVMVGGIAKRPAERFLRGREVVVSTGFWVSIPADEPPILRLGKVPDSSLVGLYRHADVVPLVSLEEGFGYPALEAIAFRAPTVVPEGSPMAERGGPGVITVSDPKEPFLVADKLEEAIRLSEVSGIGAWAFADREYYSPERYFSDLLSILTALISD